MADPEEGPGVPAPPPLFFRPIFWETGPSPYLRVWMTTPPPPPLISRSGSGTDFNVSECSTLSTHFSTCQALKAWFDLLRVNLYRNDLRRNKNYFELAGGSSYRSVSSISRVRSLILPEERGKMSAGSFSRTVAGNRA